MYAVVRILEGGNHAAVDVPEAARGLVEAPGGTTGLVTLLAIKGDDGALVTVEIFETLDDLRVAEGAAGRDTRRSPAEDGSEGGRTISGEIVFQRGL